MAEKKEDTEYYSKKYLKKLEKKTGRDWCFTLNNPSKDAKDFFERFTDSNVRYCIIGREVAKSGTPHFQGYLEFTSPVRFSYVKNLISKRCHIEKRMFPVRASARDYCKKDGLFEEWGEWDTGGQGARSDLFSLFKTIKEGSSLREIVERHPRESVKYLGNIEKIRKLFQPKRNWKTEVVVYWGPTGSGKSRRAYEEGGPDAYSLDMFPWFEGYDGEEVIIWDEFDPKVVSRTDFLRVTDRYQYRVGNKGSSVQLLARKIIITSNFDPANWYGRDPAVARRLTACHEVGKVILGLPTKKSDFDKKLDDFYKKLTLADTKFYTMN